MWWNREECNNMLLSARDDVISFCQTYKETIKEFTHLVTVCNSMSTSSSLSQHGIIDETFLKQYEHSTLSQTSIRGFEMDVSPILKVIRKKHVKSVVEHSKKIPKSCSKEDMKSRMIAQRSIQLSRPLIVLSQVIGQTDQKEAL